MAGALLAACVALLMVAHQLRASPSGVGTHQQLGLAACGFLGGTGWPCATCGMTTAFAAAAHGDILLALKVQPAGGVLAVGTAMLAVLSGWALVSGAAISLLLRPLLRPAAIGAFAVLILAAWAYKAYTMGALGLALGVHAP